MADGGEIRTGIVLDGDDQTSPAFTSASKNAGMFQKKITGVGDQVNSLPDKLGKASTAILLFQNSTAQMSGQMADAANKLTAVVGLVASGGPIGVGLAAMTLAITAGSAAWSTYTMEARNAEAAQRSIQAVMAQGVERLVEQKAEATDVETAINNFGQTAEQVAINDLELLIQQSEKSTAALDEQRTSLFYSNRQFREMDDATKQHHDNLKQIVDRTKEMNDVRRKQLADMQKLLAMQKEKEAKDKREAAALANSLARRNESLALLQQERQAIETASMAGEITAQTYDAQATKLDRMISVLQKKTTLTQREAKAMSELADTSKGARVFEAAALKEATDNTEKQLAMIDQLTSRRQMEIDKRLQMEESIRAAQVQAAEESQQRWMATGTTIGTAVGNAFSAIATGAMSASEAL